MSEGITYGALKARHKLSARTHTHERIKIIENFYTVLSGITEALKKGNK